MIDFDKIEGFQWDKGNLDKNWKFHKVLNIEAEQIFFNKPLIIQNVEKHSTGDENRFYALGKTDLERYLFIVFTIRSNSLRILSARDMSKKERSIYDEEENNPKI